METVDKLSLLYKSMNLSKTDIENDFEHAYTLEMVVDNKIISWTIDKNICSITDYMTGETINYSYSSNYDVYNEITAIYENSKTDTEYEDGIYIGN